MLEKTNKTPSSATILAEPEPSRDAPSLREQGEFGAIERFAAKLKLRAGVAIGIGDDCAVLSSLKVPVISCDALVEGVHFRRDWTSAFDLGRKTLTVSVSDLASTGARPVAAFLSLCAPPDLEMAWLDSFYEGLESLARQFDFSVAGGDTTRSNQLVLNATLVGELLSEANEKPLLRSGAKVGDFVCVTGNLGASAAGLQFLLSERKSSTSAHEEVLKRHFNPTPRVKFIRALMRTNRDALHAGMDISDGLVGDARHIAARSGVRLNLDANQLPISNATLEVALQLGLDARELALGGGEDYELLLCVAPESFEELKRAVNGELTKIGEVGEGAGVEVLNAQERGSWTHF